jgi:uncharacterized protein (TIGR03083 family)
MTPIQIATDADLRPIDGRYRQLFIDQADRLGRQLAGFSDKQWHRSSRNSGWTMHQTMQHVAGVRIENVRRFDGEPGTWPPFDPNTTPQLDIDRRAEETPAQTIEGLADSTKRLLDHLAARTESEEQLSMVWGEQADFRLLFIHIFWDSFVHERDVLLPLGIKHNPTAEQLGFAVAYGLLMAGVALRTTGKDLHIEVAIGNVGRAELDVTATRIVVTVDDAASSPGALTSPSGGALVDALSGRGEVADILQGPADVVGALSLFASFLRG